MAFYGKKKKAAGTSVRLTGLFAAKKRGLFVGSTEELDPIKDVIRRAMKEEKGLVFFLWKNDTEEDNQPKYTIYMDVSQDQESRPKSRAIVEPDDDDDDYLDTQVPKGTLRRSKKNDEDPPF